MKKIDKTCPICSKQFTVPFCHRDRYLTCGHKCGGLFRRKKIINNICELCSIEFVSKKTPTKNQAYCSRTCALKSRRNRIDRDCIECKKSFQVTPHRLKEGNRGVFCSRSCQLKKWNRDSIKAQMPGSYRQNAWKTFEKRCYACGNIDERLLVIHHIDGNRKNGKLSNLIPLCHNCHCLAHIEMNGNGCVPSYRGKD